MYEVPRNEPQFPYTYQHEGNTVHVIATDADKKCLACGTYVLSVPESRRRVVTRAHHPGERWLGSYCDKCVPRAEKRASGASNDHERPQHDEPRPSADATSESPPLSRRAINARDFIEVAMTVYRKAADEHEASERGVRIDGYEFWVTARKVQ